MWEFTEFCVYNLMLYMYIRLNFLSHFQMKLPASLGQKKTKAIEQVLEELGIGIKFSMSVYVCDFCVVFMLSL